MIMKALVKLNSDLEDAPDTSRKSDGMKERWQQIENLFQAALELEAHERAAFLDQSYGDDVYLRKEVDSLLAYKEQPGELISFSPIDEAVRLLAEDGDESLVGQTIDHYRIVATLGAGGMAEVYLAED